MFIFNSTLGIITPPVGGNLFVAAQISKAPFEEIVKGNLAMDTDHGNWTDICNIHTADVYLAAWLMK